MCAALRGNTPFTRAASRFTIGRVRRLRPLFPYVILLLLAALASQPLARAESVCSDDGPFHLFRAVELGALLQAGHWFPRWAPHMAQGYGFPFYNFYAPLSSYVVVLLHTLGLEYPLALKVAFALALWLAGCGAFLFGREVWSERAGLVTGIAYLFAPYLAYDVFFRANLAETFAFIWPPLVLWELERSAITRSGQLLAISDPVRGDRRVVTGYSLLAALSYAALILTHNIFALIASPLFVGYVALRAWQLSSWRLLARGVMALLLGIGLTAYFWLPAIGERDLVHSDRLFVPPIFTWYTNFLSPGELLAGPRAEDPLLINPSPSRAIGLVTALLTLPGVIVTGWRALARRQRPAGEAWRAQAEVWPVAFFFVALVGYGLLTLSISKPIWQFIRPLELVQFPWRMLGPAALCAAILVGGSAAVLEQHFPRFGRAAPAGVMALVVLGNLSWWYPRYCPAPQAATLADMVAYERATATIGTTAKGEYLPRTVAYLPEDDSLAQAIERGDEPVRLQVVEGEASIQPRSAQDPLDAAFTVSARTNATLVYRQFLYPGWQVVVDGLPAAIGSSAGTGLITFSVSPGEHAIRVTFGSTPLRTAAVVVSVLSLMGLGIGGWWLAAGRWPLAPGRQPLAPVWDLGVAAVLILALKFLIIDRVPNPLRQSAFDGERVAQAQTTLRADFEGGLGMYGYDLSPRTVAADEGVDAALYVSMRAPALRHFWPVLYVKDADGLAWTGADSFIPPRWHREPPPTSDWVPEMYAQWARRVTFLPGTPPGPYEVWGEVIDRQSGAVMSLLDEQGQALQPQFALGALTVTRPREPFRLAPETPAPHPFGPITFLGYAVDRRQVKAGEALLLTWYWRSQSAAEQNYLAHIELRDASGVSAFQSAWPPAGHYPTSQWLPGDEWRGQVRLIVPAGLQGGEYELVVSVPSQSGEQALGSITVEAPERVFEPPAFQQASGAQFEDVGELAGYTLEPGDSTLTVTLVWKAIATPSQSYQVFVHLGEIGRVWAQSDRLPAEGRRPTTGWVAGEYVVDVHTLALPDELPPGEYQVWVGLYEPRSGLRVPARGPGAADDARVAIGAVTLP